MSNNPGQRSSSIYQQDAFSTHLDSSNAQHLPPHTKVNGQVNRLSRVFDGAKDHPYRPPPPPSKPQALRSTTTRRSSRNEESSPPQTHSPSVRIQPADRPLSATSITTDDSEPDQAADQPTMSFKDLQAKFQRAASTNETKSSAGKPKWQVNTGASHLQSSTSTLDPKPKYPNLPPVPTSPSLIHTKPAHLSKPTVDQPIRNDSSSSVNSMYHTPRLAPSIPEKPSIIIKSHAPRDIATEIAQKLEQGPPIALVEKRDDSRNHLASSPKHSNVHKTLPTLPNTPINRSSLHSRPEPINTTTDSSFSKSSQRKAWMVNTMKGTASPGPPSLASSPSLEVPIARSTTGNSVSSTASSSSTGSQANGTQHKRGRGYSGFGSLFGGGSSAEDHHQAIKSSITIVSREPMPQRDSVSSTGSTRPPSSADFTPYTSQPVSPLLDGRDPAAKRSMKRYNVIKELVETERTYRNDMILLKEVYYDGALAASSPIDKADVKQLFSNLPTIVDFETEFLALLESSCNTDGGAVGDDNESEITLAESSKGDEQSSCIGMAYIAVMPQIEQIYCDYCKRQEGAILRLQELEAKPEVQAFFKACQQEIQDRTTSWDLGSMLIKPVQRVLKYPLLLQQIRTLTLPTHPDFENLERASKEIQDVADRINEIKRRKDIVEKIVGDRRRTDVSKFKQATGIAAEGTQDAFFDALFVKFEEQQETARQLARDVQGWLRHVKENFESMFQLAVSLEDLYTSWGGVTVKSLERVKAFKDCAVSLTTSLSRELETLVRSIVYSRIDSFLKLFNNPQQVILKRANKLIDHDRANGIKAKGGVPDKALQESADAYLSINAQLVDELPKFLLLSTQYFNFIVEEFAEVQIKFNKLMAGEWKRYMFKGPYAFTADGKKLESMTLESITSEYNRALQELEPSIQDIVAINPPQWEDIPGFQSTGSDSTASTPSLPVMDQYFNSSFGSIRTPSLQSLPISEGTPHRRTPQRTGSSFSNDVFSNSISLASHEDSWSDSGSSALGDRPLFERVIMFDCDSGNQDQLSVRQGEMVAIWQADDDEWWYASCKHNGQENWGWVLAAA
ncbi:hypothetical protein INT44_009042, partial [Umbelopsis vinacea]